MYDINNSVLGWAVVGPKVGPKWFGHVSYTPTRSILEQYEWGENETIAAVVSIERLQELLQAEEALNSAVYIDWEE